MFLEHQISNTGPIYPDTNTTIIVSMDFDWDLKFDQNLEFWIFLLDWDLNGHLRICNFGGNFS